MCAVAGLDITQAPSGLASRLLRQVARNGVCRVLRMSFLTWLTSAYYSQNDESFGIIWRIVVGDWLNILNFFVFVKCCVPPFLSCTIACVWVCVLIFAAVYSYCFFVLFFFADILLMRVLCLFLVLGSKFHLHMSPYSASRSFYFSRDQRPFLSTPFVIQRLYLFVCRPKVENLVILCACTCETISTPWSRLVWAMRHV